MAEEPTSPAWIAVKDSLTTARRGDWLISGVSVTQKHWQEFAGKFMDSFRLFEVLLQRSAG
jgi:hypothetical protein